MSNIYKPKVPPPVNQKYQQQQQQGQNKQQSSIQNKTIQQPLNLLEWEKSIKFSDNLQNIFKELDALDQQSNTQTFKKNTKKTVKSIQEIQKNKNQENQENSNKNSLNIKFDFNNIENQISKIQEEQNQLETKQKKDIIFGQIKEIKHQNSKFLTFLNDILGNLEDIQKQFTDLQKNKQQLTGQISQFYDQSQKIIDHEKQLLTLQQYVKENLQYYTQAEDIERDLEEISFDMSQRSVFENMLQRYLSEINDGIIFFESNSKFTDSQHYLDLYNKLKARILSLIKSFFFKLFNKEFAYTNEYFNSFGLKSLEQMLKNNYTDMVEFTDPENNNIQIINPINVERCQFHTIIFPQFQHIFSQNHRPQLQEKQLLDTKQFQINQTLKYLISYIENCSYKDTEISQIYLDVFINYLTYCRNSLHKEIVDELQQIFQKQQIQNLKDLKEKDQQQQQQQPCNLLNNLFHFCYEIMLIEFLYTDYVFNYSNKLTIDSIKQHWKKILDYYYEFIRQNILKMEGIEKIFESLEIVKNYNKYYLLLFNKAAQQDIYYKDLKNLKLNKETINILNEMYSNFTERIRQDLMHKLTQQAQVYIQENITSFDTNKYINKRSLVINQYDKSNDSNAQQKEYYPIVLNASKALKLLQKPIEKSIFQTMACDIVTSTMNQLCQIAEKYQEKFDAYLFLSKNLIYLSESIINLDMDFVVKEEKLDFSETKSMLKDVIAGNFQYNFNISDITQADKLWNYASSFFNFLYKGMPKINQMTIDLKQDIILQIKNVFNNMNKDITFIISKTIIDFIRKYQQLSAMKVQNEEKIKSIQEEIEYKIQIQKDLETEEDGDVDADAEENQNQNKQQQEQQKQNQQKLLNKQIEQDQKQIQQLQILSKKIDEDIQLLMQKDIIQKTYVLFVENLKEMSLIMVLKLKNFVDEELYLKLIQHLKDIQQNAVDLLSQFYIIISKNIQESLYDQFKFIELEKLKEDLLQIINI